MRSVGAVSGLASVLLLASLAAARDECTARLRPGDDVQHAIDRVQASSRPRRICLGAGEFRLPGFVSITRGGLTLRGEGRSTVLRLADGVQSPLIVVGDYAHETPERPTSLVTIERLRLVGGGREG